MSGDACGWRRGPGGRAGAPSTARWGRRGTETLLSYASRYRDWRRAGGDPQTQDRSFAELAALARELRTADARS